MASCPKCGHHLEIGAQAGTGDFGPIDKPEEIQICAGCGGALKVQRVNPLLYRTLSMREFQALDEMTRLRILKAQEIIRQDEAQKR